MTYIENIFACIAAPLLVAALCMGKKYLRLFLFVFAGMGACLLSAYINTFLAAFYQTTAFHATAEIAPMVEEVMKLLPLLFYLFVFEPEPEDVHPAILIIAAGFATFESKRQQSGIFHHMGKLQAGTDVSVGPVGADWSVLLSVVTPHGKCGRETGSFHVCTSQQKIEHLVVVVL